MKKALLLFLAVIVLSLHVHSIFANGQTEQVSPSDFQNEKQIIQHLFQERANLWNSLYETPQEIETYGVELKRITTEPLYTFDLESFREAIEYPHDLEKVIDVKVLHINSVEYGNSDLKVDARVLWRMQGLGSNYEQEIKYAITLKKENNVWKLSDYMISQ